jgi:hypothetical protein
MLVAFCTEGHMNAFDVKHECGKEGWVPLVVLKIEGRIILPNFTSNQICKKFCERNLSKKWFFGGVTLTDEDIESIKNKGWEFQSFDFPRLVKDRYSIEVEIHEFASEFETQNVRV